jgi:nucleoside-diphosphate-sugar epimerase
MHKQRGLGVVIFRPGIVLGPGGNPLHWGIAGWPFSSVPRLYGSGHDALPIVLVDDCADALVRAQKVPHIEGETFNLIGEPCLTAQQYLDELERASGLKFHRVPTSSVRFLAEDIGKYVIKTVGRDPLRTFPSWANWDGRSMAARFDATRARQKLGWQPTTDRERVIREGIVTPAAQFLS